MDVEVTYRDGSLPTTFTVEELKDIEERIDFRSEWASISLNRYVPKTAIGIGIPARCLDRA
jgi:hypothetical protein